MPLSTTASTPCDEATASEAKRLCKQVIFADNIAFTRGANTMIDKMRPMLAPDTDTFNTRNFLNGSVVNVLTKTSEYTDGTKKYLFFLETDTSLLSGKALHTRANFPGEPPIRQYAYGGMALSLFRSEDDPSKFNIEVERVTGDFMVAASLANQLTFPRTARVLYDGSAVVAFVERVIVVHAMPHHVRQISEFMFPNVEFVDMVSSMLWCIDDTMHLRVYHTGTKNVDESLRGMALPRDFGKFGNQIVGLLMSSAMHANIFIINAKKELVHVEVVLGDEDEATGLCQMRLHQVEVVGEMSDIHSNHGVLMTRVRRDGKNYVVFYVEDRAGHVFKHTLDDKCVICSGELRTELSDPKLVGIFHITVDHQNRPIVVLSANGVTGVWAAGFYVKMPEKEEEGVRGELIKEPNGKLIMRVDSASVDLDPGNDNVRVVYIHGDADDFKFVPGPPAGIQVYYGPCPIICARRMQLRRELEIKMALQDTKVLLGAMTGKARDNRLAYETSVARVAELEAEMASDQLSHAETVQKMENQKKLSIKDTRRDIKTIRKSLADLEALNDKLQEANAKMMQEIEKQRETAEAAARDRHEPVVVEVAGEALASAEARIKELEQALQKARMSANTKLGSVKKEMKASQRVETEAFEADRKQLRDEIEEKAASLKRAQEELTAMVDKAVDREKRVEELERLLEAKKQEDGALDMARSTVEELSRKLRAASEPHAANRRNQAVIAGLNDKLAELRQLHIDKSDMLAHSMVEARRLGAEVERIGAANVQMSMQLQSYQAELGMLHSEFVMNMRAGYMPEGDTIQESMEKLKNIEAMEAELLAKTRRIAQLETNIENLQKHYVPPASASSPPHTPPTVSDEPK